MCLNTNEYLHDIPYGTYWMDKVLNDNVFIG